MNEIKSCFIDCAFLQFFRGSDLLLSFARYSFNVVFYFATQFIHSDSITRFVYGFERKLIRC